MFETPRSMALGTALAAVLALGIAAEAAAGGTRAERFLERIDGDGDGTVTRAEVLDANANRFEEIDANGDGTVSAEEFEADRLAKVRARISKHFGRLDADDDGSLSQEEFAARAAGWFDRVDQDGDGKLSEDEIAARRHHGHRSGG